MTLYGTLAPNGDTSICYGPLTLDANAHACMFRETFVNGQCDLRLPVRLLGDGRMSETIASTFSRDAVSLTWATPRAGDHPNGFDELRRGGHGHAGRSAT